VVSRVAPGTALYWIEPPEQGRPGTLAAWSRPAGRLEALSADEAAALLAVQFGRPVAATALLRLEAGGWLSDTPGDDRYPAHQYWSRRLDPDPPAVLPPALAPSPRASLRFVHDTVVAWAPGRRVHRSADRSRERFIELPFDAAMMLVRIAGGTPTAAVADPHAAGWILAMLHEGLLVPPGMPRPRRRAAWSLGPLRAPPPHPVPAPPPPGMAARIERAARRLAQRAFIGAVYWGIVTPCGVAYRMTAAARRSAARRGVSTWRAVPPAGGPDSYREPF